MGRVDSLGHDTCKVGVEDSDILERCDYPDVSIWSNSDDCPGTTVDPVGGIRSSTGIERDVYIVNEDPKALHNH